MTENKNNHDPKSHIKTGNDIVVHTMPKVFNSSSVGPVSSTNKGTENSRTVGLLILVGGVFVLIAVLGFFYYFLTSENKTIVNEPITTGVAQKDEISTNQENKGSGTSVVEDEQQKESEEDILKKTTTDLEEEKTDISKDFVATTTNMTDTTQTKGATSTVIEKTEPKIVVDTDKDGLSDIEEVLLGSNVNLTDSDGDGYGDLVEVLGLYNPAGQSNILTNSNIEKYTNNKYGYSVYYSSFWPIELVGGEESVMFKLNNNQFINIIVEDNSESLFINDWYKKQFDNPIIKPNQIIVKKGWNGLRSNDGLIAYLMHPSRSKIFVLSYNLGLERTENYKNIFNMVIESLKLEE